MWVATVGRTVLGSRCPQPSPIHYAGMEYDSETQLYHTMFRYYNPRLGLWMTPDPAGMGAASSGDPQSFNRYGYVINDPCNTTDPYGLAPCKIFVSGLSKDIVDLMNGIFSGADIQIVSTTAKGADFVVKQNVALGDGVAGKAEAGNKLIDINNGWLQKLVNEDKDFPQVPMPNIDIGFGIARVTSHEIYHKFFGPKHTATGLMREMGGVMVNEESNPDGSYNFSTDQLAGLSKKCRDLRKAGGKMQMRGGSFGGGGGGGAGPTNGGGSSVVWQACLYIVYSDGSWFLVGCSRL